MASIKEHTKNGKIVSFKFIWTASVILVMVVFIVTALVGAGKDKR